jgi:hypothetical protein
MSTSTAANADSVGPIVLNPGEHLVRSEKFVTALLEYAREINAVRGSTPHLRHRLREAVRAGRVPHLRTGNCTAFRLSDVPRVAAILGFRPENYELS